MPNAPGSVATSKNGRSWIPCLSVLGFSWCFYKLSRARFILFHKPLYPNLGDILCLPRDRAFVHIRVSVSSFRGMPGAPREFGRSARELILVSHYRVHPLPQTSPLLGSGGSLDEFLMLPRTPHDWKWSCEPVLRVGGSPPYSSMASVSVSCVGAAGQFLLACK